MDVGPCFGRKHAVLAVKNPKASVSPHGYQDAAAASPRPLRGNLPNLLNENFVSLIRVVNVQILLSDHHELAWLVSNNPPVPINL
jgi:hypothetical protein